MDLSCRGIPPEQQALETPGHYIPATPEKSATTKRTLISVFNGQGIPAFESLVDVPVALLSPLPGKSVSSTVNQIVTSPVASITPGNDKSVQHCNIKEAVPLAIEDLNNKRRLKEFHMLQTGATGKRIDLCADNGFSNPSAPLTPYKDKTAENCQPPETTELADMRLTVGNIQENCMNKKVPFLDANSSLGGLYPRYMENERDEDEETQGIDLNKTPRKKFVKRKRHRPKVIQEDKPIKSPKPITPKIDENKEELTPKRTYVRKKQRLSSSRCPSAAIEEKKEKPIPIKTYVRKRKTSSSSASGMNLCSTSPTEVRNVDQLSRDTTKSVRRSLNFSLEGDTRDDINVSTENDVEFVALKTFNCSSIGCSREFTVELTQGLEVSLTESPVGIAFDLNRSLNQVLDEYIQLPEHPTLSAQSYRRETVKEHLKDFNSTKDVDSDMYMRSCQEKCDAGSHLDIILIDNDIDKIGTKRDYEHIDVSKDCSAKESQQDISLTHECNGNKQNRLCQETSSPSLYWPVIFKKRRQERRQISGYNMALTTPFGRLQQSELKLLFHPTQRSTGKRSKVATPVCKRIPKAGAEDCSHLLGSEKTKGSFLRRENKNNEPQSCMDALFADARFKTTTKKRRKKRHFCLVSSTLSNMKQEYVVAPNKFSFVGQPLVLELAASQWKNLNQTQFCSIQDCHWRSSGMQRSFYANFQPQAVVPYMDPVEFIVERMKHMKISEDQIQAIGKGKHALIRYGGGSMLVPYKRFFDIVKKQRPRAKVDLDPETNRVWNLLMWKTSGDEAGGVDMDKEKWWKEEREIFRGRADAFIARMHLILGDRRFSKWKGSVVDSVVGVFLTQNVSDHLSSSAFMSLAARFPLQTRGKSTEANVENMNTSEEQGDGNVPAGSHIIKWQEKMSMPEVIDPDSTGTYKKEKEAADVSSSLGSNNRNETDCLEANVLQSHGREQEIRTGAPQNRINTAVPATGVISLRKNEDGMILEDVVLSQTSVISLEESSEYQIQTGQVGLCSESVTQSEDLVIRSKCIASDNPASFIDCSLIRETRTTNESYNNGGGEKLSAENTGAVDQEVACKKVEKREEVAEKLCCPDGAFPSVNMSNILVSHPKHDTKDLSPSPSTPHCTHNFLNTGPIRMENADTVTGRVGSSWVSTAFEITRTYDINIIEGGAGQQTLLTKSMTIMEDGSHVSNRKLHAQTSTCSESQICLEKHIGCQDNLPGENFEESLRENIFHELSQVHDEQSIEVRPEERYTDFPAENTDKEVEIPSETQHCGAQAEYLSSCNDLEETLENLNAVQFDIENKVCSTQNVQPERGKSTPRARKVNGGETEKKMFDWDGLRKDAFLNGAKNERSSDTLDSLDWEAVRNTDVSEISNTIRERGMNNVLAQRIKDFLNRLVTDHGGIDLEWLRNVPPEKAKDYLLSIRGLGIKSVECVRLLTLHHLAFPVDTNVGRIAVRLGWVPLQPLPESLQLHLLELYPMIEHIQKYLWPRLCTLDQQTLYELHYQMITFGKVFCTKTKPNCNACPMRGECKHFASAFASARLALPGPEEKGLVTSKFPSIVENDISRNFRSLPLPQLDGNKHAKVSVIDDCQPIIEEPTTPEHECTEALETAIEDAFYEDHEDIPTIKLSSEEFKKNLKNYMQENKMEIQDEDMSKALVAITVEAASIPMPKLKNVSRLRTEHLVYELPDSHPLLEGMDYRVPDDPSPYLLAIWTPGETAQSMEPPQSCCNSQDSSKLCDRKTCFACNTVREAQAQIVRGTILIPCRTAMKGSFPLNGTYFQVNEVFADHISSRTPIDVPRKWIWNLPRRTVFFGTSVPTIFRGLTTESIQRCFWRGFVCVRGFDRITRAPKPLYARLHFPPSKAVQNNKTPAKEEK